MLICYARAFSVEFDMDTIAVGAHLEEFARDSDGGRVRVLGIVDTLGLCEGASRKFT